MTMVWPTSLSVEEYVAAGRGLAVPLLGCPGCGELMGWWGSYERDVRVGRVWRVAIRRQRCGDCGTSHGVLPGFVVRGRLDVVEVIGSALSLLGRGRRGVRPVARFVDIPRTTVRDWLWRFGARAEMLAVGFSRFCVAVGGTAPRLSGDAGVVALGAVGAAWRTARRRFGLSVGRRWRFANAVVGGQLLSLNTDPPWSAG